MYDQNTSFLFSFGQTGSYVTLFRVLGHKTLLSANGVLYLFCFWWHPLLEGFLLALSLKSKLVSTVLGPWLT